ncbi:MAG: hypothetical protein AABZ23_03885 [Deltaproteobacteria bacterium]
MKLQELKEKIHDLRLKAAGAPTVHCLGDSHLMVFEYIAKEGLLKHTRLQFCIVQGATAMGIPNPASKTQAGPIFNEYLKKVPLNDYILTCLGEVDCGFVIWYRSKKYDEPVEKQFDLAISNYTNFLSSLMSEGRKNIIICSAPLPTIKDGQTWGEIASMRNEVDATLRQRTDMTLDFNERIRDFSRRNGLVCIDIEQEIMNQDTMLINDKFLNPDMLDHHLHPPLFAEVILQELRRKGFS